MRAAPRSQSRGMRCNDYTFRGVLCCFFRYFGFRLEFFSGSPVDPQWTPSGPSLDASNEREVFVGIVCKTVYESHLLNKKLYIFVFYRNWSECTASPRNCELTETVQWETNGDPLGVHCGSTGLSSNNQRNGQHQAETAVVRSSHRRREITSSQETAAREKGVGICCGREACVKTRPAKYRSPCAILRRRRAWRVCLRLTVYPGQARKMWPGSSGSGPCGRAASSSG